MFYLAGVGKQRRKRCGSCDQEKVVAFSYNKRGFCLSKIDVTTCDKRQRKLHPICVVKDPKQIKRYLEHVGVPSEAPEKPPPIFEESFAYEL